MNIVVFEVRNTMKCYKLLYDYENDRKYIDCKWVDRFLGPGEIILWKGTPLQTHLTGKKDWYMIPFSILWFSFAVLLGTIILWFLFSANDDIF